MPDQSFACATRAHARPDAALVEIVRYATLAPSSHNSQPWTFRHTAGALELLADSRRALPKVDPRGREVVISCGAALFHARVALRRFGFRDDVELLPDRRNQELLARLRPGAAHRPTADERALFEAMPRRRTYRFPFEPRPIAPEIIAQLLDAAAEEDAWLQVLEEEGVRQSVASLIVRGDRIQMADAELRREAAKDRDLALGSPVLAVLGSFGDSRYDWLLTGQALARVLLRARVAGVSASFLNQPIEVPELRAELQQAITGADHFPQLLLRMGYATGEARATPRRPIQDVLIDAAPPT